MTIRDRVLKKGCHCVMCFEKGFITLATEVDHKVPLFKGGTDAEENLQPLCADCHVDKTRMDLDQRVRSRTGLDGWPID
jgi:5-methylcytosine-specific restriction protein A